MATNATSIELNKRTTLNYFAFSSLFFLFFNKMSTSIQPLNRIHFRTCCCPTINHQQKNCFAEELPKKGSEWRERKIYKKNTTNNQQPNISTVWRNNNIPLKLFACHLIFGACELFFIWKSAWRTHFARVCVCKSVCSLLNNWVQTKRKKKK